MKSLTKAMVIGVLAIFFLFIFPQKFPSNAIVIPQCYLYHILQNDDRHCYADDLHAECGWEPEGYHIPPFGNWGVVSNLADKEDGDQFTGWKWTEFWGHWDWNSCTVDHHQWKPPTTCGDLYNCKLTPPDLCWQQHTSQWENVYAGILVAWHIPIPFWEDG